MKISITFLVAAILGLNTITSFAQTKSELISEQNDVVSVKDGNKNEVTLDTPRTMLLSPNKKQIYLFDNNGWQIRTINQAREVKTTDFNLGNLPKTTKTTRDPQALLIPSPSNHIIIQIDNQFEASLFAGGKDEGEESKKNSNSASLTDARFFVPLSITDLGNTYYLVLENAGDALKLIHGKQVESITYPEWLTEAGSLKKIVKGNKNAELWAFGMSHIVKFSFNPKTKKFKKLKAWHSDEKQAFHEIAGIAFDNNHVMVIDTESSSIMSLDGNRFKTVYQAPCANTIVSENNGDCRAIQRDVSKRLPVTMGFDSIIKNPWDKGFIISDANNNVLYQFKNNQLSLFLGKYSDISRLTPQEQDNL